MSLGNSDLVAQLGVDVQPLKEGLDQVSTMTSDLAGKLAGLGATLSAAITAPLVGLGAASLKTAGDLEQSRIAMTTLTGSAEKANKHLSDLEKFAAATPFEFKGLITASTRLQGFGFEADKIVPILTRVGDAAAGVGKGQQGIDSIIGALGKMKAQGNVTTEAMNMLTDQGINGWKYLASAIGTDIPTAMKMVETKSVEAGKGIAAVLEGTAKDFGGMMDAQSKTMLGRWSTLKDNLDKILTTVGEALLPLAGQLMDFFGPVLEFAQSMAEKFKELDQPTQAVIVGFAALVAAIGPLLLAAAGVAAAISSISAALPVLAAVFAPIPLAIAAVVAALAALGVWIYSNWDAIVQTLQNAWNELKAVWGVVWNSLPGWFTTILGTIGSTILNYWSWLAGVLGSVWNGMVGAAKVVWESILKIASSIVDLASKIPGLHAVMNFDNVSASLAKAKAEAQGLGKGIDDAKTATSGFAKENKELAGSLEGSATAAGKKTTATHKLTDAEKEHNAEIKKSQAELKKWADLTSEAGIKTLVLTEIAKKFEDKWRASVKAIVEAKVALMETGASILNFSETFQVVNKAIESSKHEMGQMSDVMKQHLVPAIDLAKDGYVQLQNALRDLGVKSQQVMEDQVKKLRESYDLIVKRNKEAGEEVVSSVQVLQARLRLLDAEIELGRVRGQNTEALRAEKEQIQGQLEKMGALRETTKETTNAWGQFGQQVSTVMTDMSKSLADVILKGGNMKDVFVNAFNTIKEAALRTIIEGVFGRITEGFRKMVLEGESLEKSFKGFFDSISKMFEGLEDKFKGGNLVPGGGSGGGSGGSGGGLPKGSLGIIDLIVSIGQLITQLVSLFVLKEIESGIDFVELNTRQINIHLLAMLDKVNLHLPKLDVITDYLYTVQTEYLNQVTDWLSQIHGKLSDIDDVLRHGKGGKPEPAPAPEMPGKPPEPEPEPEPPAQPEPGPPTSNQSIVINVTGYVTEEIVDTMIRKLNRRLAIST